MPYIVRAVADFTGWLCYFFYSKKTGKQSHPKSTPKQQHFDTIKRGKKMAKNMGAYYAIRSKKSAEKKERERYEKSNEEYLERIEANKRLNEFRASQGFTNPITPRRY